MGSSIVAQRPAVLELLAVEEEAHLVGRDALPAPDQLFYVVNRRPARHRQRKGLAGQRLYVDLKGARHRRCGRGGGGVEGRARLVRRPEHEGLDY